MALVEALAVRVAVTGGRDFNDREFIFSTLDRLEIASGCIFRGLIHGACPTGLDQIAAAWQRGRIERGRAICNEIRRTEKHHPVNCSLWIWGFPARWYDLTTPPVVLRRRKDGTPYNAAAGAIRNGQMLRQGKPAWLIAFPGGPGTTDCVKQARGLEIEVKEVRP
jgi:hypothetical protein